MIKTRYGTINAPMKVFVDSNPADDVVVKYKGKEFDSGAFYCPYVPLHVYESPSQRLNRKRLHDTFPWRLRTVWSQARRAIGRILRSLVQTKRS